MALADDEFDRYCQKLELGEAACRLIEQIRYSEPSRRVRGRAGNVCVRYPSQKMGRVIQAESHRVEFAGILEYEFTLGVLEYYDQPPSIKLTYQTTDGKHVAPLHTPDFFVLREDSAGWEEWKPETELHKLAEQKPNRYQRDADGRWRCPPGEQHAAQYGLYYRVRSSAEIDWCWQRNIDFLADYLQTDQSASDPGAVNAILDHITQEPGLTLSTLLQADLGVTSDDVYSLIATGRLYVDLHAAPLAEPERIHLFRDRETAEAYGVIRTEIAARVGKSPDHHMSAAQDGIRQQPHIAVAVGHAGLEEGVRDILTHASAEDLARAQARYEAILPLLSGQQRSSTRTQRHWVKKYRQAEWQSGSGYLGLIDQRHKQGNRAAKLPGNLRERMEQQIATEYETIQQQGVHVAYGKFAKACEALGLRPPSHVTYYHTLHRRPRHDQIAKREGPKAAYPHEPFWWELTMTTPRHGDWPFHIVHLDHTQLDIEVIHSKTKRPLGRPWLTLVMDAYSRRILALYLSFDEPSYRSCMMAMRLLVARHQRLPKVIVVDGGPEFKSIYFESLLARYNRTLKTRPGGKPRFGAVIERLFGTTHQDFIHNLSGNTQIMRKVRQVTKTVNPKENATWTLEALHSALCEWAFEVYDTLDHSALGQSPREAFTQGIAQTGARLSQVIAYDENFILETLPTTPRGKAKVEPNRGVKINYLYYWSEAFRSRAVEGHSVPIRYDPFDAGVAYAFIQANGKESGRWVRCLSEYYSRFKGRSEREIRLATAELRRQKHLHSKTITPRARTLATFLESSAGRQVVEDQRDRDSEARLIRQSASLLPSDHSLEPAVETPPGTNPPDDVDNVNEPVEIYGDF